MNRRLRLSLISTLALALAACNAQVQGNGQLAVESRTVAPFDQVDLSLGIEASVTANAASQALSLSGDSNLLQYVLTPVEAGVLKTRLNGVDSIDPINPLRLTAQAVALHRVKATEASIVDVKGAGSSAAGFSFEVEAAARSSVALAGSGGQHLEVRLSGASALDAWSYPVAGANVLLAGGSRLRVNTVSDVTGSAADKSKVFVTGGGGCGGLVLSSGATCEAPP